MKTASFDTPSWDSGMREIQMWSRWADQVEVILRQMANEVRDLSLEECAGEDLVELAVKIAKHSPRPGVPVDNNGDDRRVRSSTCILRARCHDEWNHWGDCVEELYLCMSENIAHGISKAGQRYGLANKEDEGDFRLPGLSLCTINTTLDNLPGLIRSMLGPEMMLQRKPDLGTSDLARRLENMSIGQRAVERSALQFHEEPDHELEKNN